MILGGSDEELELSDVEVSEALVVFALLLEVDSTVVVLDAVELSVVAA